MSYVLRYQFSVEYTDAQGVGQNVLNLQGSFATLGPKLQMFNATPVGSQTFTSTDINNFAAQMQTDVSTQLLLNQTRIQGFASGGG